MIHYLDEIDMPGGGNPNNRRDLPDGPKEDPRYTFEPAGRTADEQKLFTQAPAPHAIAGRLGRAAQRPNGESDG